MKEYKEAIQEEKRKNFSRDFAYLIRNVPFWIIDKHEHKARYELCEEEYGVACCCFNHLIGLPRKADDFGVMQPHPLYEYECILYDNLINKGIKWQWVKKATGLGITEFYLRLILWFCFYEGLRERFNESQICIVVGPNLELGKKLMTRTKRMFNNLKETPKIPLLKGFILDGSAKEIVVNNVTITVFPSNHLDAMRGLPNVSFIFIDEADYFPPNEQLNVLTVTTRYVAKSDVWIAMVSTPGLPDGLFSIIENDKHSPFDKQFFDYKWGMHYHDAEIFTPKMIAEARLHRAGDFAREYENQYAGFAGNVFSVQWLYELQKRSKDYDVVKILEDEFNKEIPASYQEYIYQDEEAGVYVKDVDTAAFERYAQKYSAIRYKRIIGIDPGHVSSKFGIVIIQIDIETNEIQIIYEAEFSSMHSNEMIDFVAYLQRTLHAERVCVDREDSDFIRGLKDELEDYEDVDYTKLTKAEMKMYIDAGMIVVPITFNRQNKRAMLYHLKELMYGGYVKIREECKMIYAALASIKVDESMMFKKKDVPHNDALDALFVGLFLVHF